MRLFLAIELPDDVRVHLVKVQKKLSSVLDGVAMTRPESLHITLKFLGEVDDRRIADLCESLSKITAGPIDLTPARLACLPPRGPVRIIAVGMDGSEQALAALHAAVQQRCQYLGFERETRKYRPHVTMARAKRPIRAGDKQKAEEAVVSLWPGPNFPVKQFVLMQSRLEPQGARYVRIAHFPLDK